MLSPAFLYHAIGHSLSATREKEREKDTMRLEAHSNICKAGK